MPYFLKESKKREKELGIPLKYWSEKEHEKFRLYFMRKYEGLVK